MYSFFLRIDVKGLVGTVNFIYNMKGKLFSSMIFNDMNLNNRVISKISGKSNFMLIALYTTVLS